MSVSEASSALIESTHHAGTGSQLSAHRPSLRLFRSRFRQALFSATLLLAAFLLFSVQPMFAKRVLPILGGTPAVWSIAMVVFQALLLAGYAYAHALVRWVPLRWTAAVHGTVLLAGMSSLPIAVTGGFEEPPAGLEAMWLIGLFLASIGLPFFSLAATAPLLQAWFARSGGADADDPYFLYRASNAGSFIALLAYPLVVEPSIGLAAQGRIWSIGYGLAAPAIMACALSVIAGARGRTEPREATRSVESVDHAISLRGRVAWMALSAVPSGLLVAGTSHLSIDVAAVPLIWVVPLALYLLSFILAFRPGPFWSSRVLTLLQVVGTVGALLIGLLGIAPFWLDLAATLALVFLSALTAHRTLYGLRPPPQRLTTFYLYNSMGGMIGGLFAALLAPNLLSGVYEYPILLVAALACRSDLRGFTRRRVRDDLRWSLKACALIALAVIPVAVYQEGTLWLAFLAIALAVALVTSWRMPVRVATLGAILGVIAISPTLGARGGDQIRSFFGVHRIQTTADGRFRTLSNGTTLHGAMKIRNDDGSLATGRPEPTTYYAAGGALADVLEVSRNASGPIPNVAVVGLGTGSLACHARPGEAWTYFEIDPAVIRIATDPTRFRFLAECAPGVRIIPGDARLTLGRSREAVRVLVVDAFSSDAIPMHLLTAEALDQDLAHLDPHGVLAIHISNRHFELRRVLARIAADRGLTLLHRYDPPSEMLARTLGAPSRVAILTRDGAVEREARALGWRPVEPEHDRRSWSDDYANPIEAMIDRWRESGASPRTP